VVALNEQPLAAVFAVRVGFLSVGKTAKLTASGML